MGALRDQLARRPFGLAEVLLARDFRTNMAREVAVVWSKQAGPAAAAPLLDAVWRARRENPIANVIVRSQDRHA